MISSFPVAIPILLQQRHQTQKPASLWKYQIIRECKLEINWEGPYKIAEVGGKETYHLEHMDGTSIIKYKKNIAKLKKYP